MVGALSIVRFRNPVRSPLELSVYFGSITLGISAAVSIKWSVLLVLSVTCVAFLLYSIHKITKFFSYKPFFITSFSEGNMTSTLYVVTSAEILELDENPSLSSKLLGSKEIKYTLLNSNFDNLKVIERSLRDNNLVVSLQLSK